MKIKVYKFINSEQEAHMMGDYVAVCWNIHQTVKKLKGADGAIYKAQVWERAIDADPYIDFAILNSYDEETDEAYKDEDSPVEGGLSPKEAIKVAIELKQACDYILNKGWETK